MMKLLTLNCHSWQEENQLEKIRYLAQTIKEKSYDVIAFQEVSQSIDAESISDSLKKDNYGRVVLDELKKLGVLNYELIWDFSHLGYEEYEEGLAILTKHPISKTDSFFITQSQDTNHWKTRKIVGTTIIYEDKPLSFYSCHLGWWNDEEEPYQDQVDALWERVQREERFFLMGDFNSPAHVENEGYQYLLSKGLYDTYELAEEKDSGTTVMGKIAGWRENNQGLRIDYIFASEKLSIKQSNILFNGLNGPVISDHFGLEIELHF